MLQLRCLFHAQVHPQPITSLPLRVSWPGLLVLCHSDCAQHRRDGQIRVKIAAANAHCLGETRLQAEQCHTTSICNAHIDPESPSRPGVRAAVLFFRLCQCLRVGRTSVTPVAGVAAVEFRGIAVTVLARGTHL